MATGGLGHILTVPPRISIDVVERKQRGKSMSCDTSLTITNPSTTTAAAYRIKTNQPLRYSASPMWGIVAARSSATVSITLDSAHIEDLRTSYEAGGYEREYKEDKFMVLGTALSAADLDKLENAGEDGQEEVKKDKIDGEESPFPASRDDRIRLLLDERCWNRQVCPARVEESSRDRSEGKYNGSLVMVEMNFPGARQAEMDDDREKVRRALTPMVQRLNGSIDDAKRRAGVLLQKQHIDNMLIGYVNDEELAREEEEEDDDKEPAKGSAETLFQNAMRGVETKPPSMSIRELRKSLTEKGLLRPPPSNRKPESEEARDKRRMGIFKQMFGKMTEDEAPNSRSADSESSSSTGDESTAEYEGNQGNLEAKPKKETRRSHAEIREAMKILSDHWTHLFAYSVALTSERDSLSMKLEAVSEDLREMADPVLAERHMDHLEAKEKRAEERAARALEAAEERARRRRERNASPEEEVEEERAALQEEASVAEKEEDEAQAAIDQQRREELLEEDLEKESGKDRDPKKLASVKAMEAVEGFSLIQIVAVIFVSFAIGRLFPLRSEYGFMTKEEYEEYESQ